MTQSYTGEPRSRKAHRVTEAVTALQDWTSMPALSQEMKFRCVYSGELDVSSAQKPRNHTGCQSMNWRWGSSTPWLYKMSKKLSGSPGAMVRRKSVMVEFKPQPYTICWYWIWNYSTQMKTAWYMMNKMHISQQRKIKLFHRNVSTMPSVLNNNRRRHAKPIFTGKLTHFAKTKITMRGNKNNHLENSNVNKCNNRIKLKKHLSTLN